MNMEPPTGAWSTHQAPHLLKKTDPSSTKSHQPGLMNPPASMLEC